MYMGIGAFAKKIGVSAATLRLWDSTGKLKPHHISEGGHRLYSDEQVSAYFGEKFNVDDIQTESFLSLSRTDMKRLIDNYTQMLEFLINLYNESFNKEG